MPSVLIVDAYKSSLVMTSEVFKDKVPGCNICIAASGKEGLEHFENQEFDLVVVDFDLPDTDGVTLSKFLRKVYSGPILITAFPEKVVVDAIESELFAYRDSSDWVRKPVKFEDLSEKIDRYLNDKTRVRKRYITDIGALLVGKGAGRGKRAPKIKGNIINLSIGGALVDLDDQMKMKIGDEITVTFHMPALGVQSSLAAAIDLPSIANDASLKPPDTAEFKKGSSKIKAKIAWTTKNKKQAGILFEKLTETHRKALESVMMQSEEIIVK